MARRTRTLALKVCLNGREVGGLRRTAAGAVSFSYDAAWLQWAHTFPISLALPLSEENYNGAAVAATFDNLLPDNSAIRRRIAERVAASGEDAVSLLAKIGRDCVGALQFLPPGAACSRPGEIDARLLTDAAIAARLKGLAASPLGMSEDDDAFRISIAGAQEKTALLRFNGKWMSPQGATPTTHILKPQIGMVDQIDLTHSVENERFCLAYCEALGLPTAKTSIVDFKGVRVLASERFDRRWTTDGRLLRLPQEDFCQALGVSPTQKYEKGGGPGIEACMRLLQGSDRPQEDRAAFFTAQIVFWLLGATDGHAKNFSIQIGPGGRFTLAPLYDVMSTQPQVDAGQLPRKRAKLAMAVGHNRHYRVDEVTPRHFRETAASVGLPSGRLKAIKSALAAGSAAALKAAASQLPKGAPAALSKSIADGVKSRAALLAEN